MQNDDSANLHVKFSGENLPSGTIDVYDLANTILAIGQTVEGIAREVEIPTREKIKIEVNALRPGSFEIDLLIKVAHLSVATAPIVGLNISNQAKVILDVFSSVIDIKKFLKGEKPEKVVVNQTGANSSVTIINIDGKQANISIPVYNILQNKSLNETVEKIFAPLSKEDGNVEAIDLSSDDSSFDTAISKDEVPYFEATDELQITENYKVKGIISAFDRKTNTGRITLSNGKRPLYEIPPMEDLEEYNNAILTVIESLKLKVPIFLIGEATLDFATNLKKIKVSKIETEAQLF